MKQSEAVRIINELAPQLGSGAGCDAESLLLKAARDRRASPAQLEKLGQVFNTASTLCTMESAKSAEDRGASPLVVDVPAMLRKYQAYEAPASRRKEQRTKKASAASPDLDLGMNFRFPVKPMEKAAAAAACVPPAPVETPLTVKMADLRAESREISSLFDEHAENTGAQASRMVALLKKAGVRRELPVEFVQDLQTHLEVRQPEVLAKLAKVWKRDTNTVLEIPENVPADTRRVAVPRCDEQILKHARNLMLSLVAMDELTQMAEENDQARAEVRVKLAAGGRELALPPHELALPPHGLANTPKKKPQGGGGSKEPIDVESWTVPGGADPNAPRATTTPTTPDLRALQLMGQVPSDKGEVGTAAMDLGKNLASAAKETASLVPDEVSVTNRLLEIMEPAGNKALKMRDDAVSEQQRLTNLQTLMMQDPVISEADPEMVASIFNTILQSRPEVAQDKATLGWLLRDALQYGGVPPSTTTELIRQRGEIGRARNTEEESRQRRYSGTPPGGAKSPAKK